MNFWKSLKRAALVLLVAAIPFQVFASPAVPQCTVLFSSAVTATSSSTSAAFSVTPTAGNYIVVLAAFVQLSGTGMGITSVTDSQGNTYAVDVQKQRTSDGAVFDSISSGKAVTSSGSFTVTVHYTDPGGAMALDFMACEVSGLASVSQLDQKGTNEVNPGTSLTVTATGANTQASEIVWTVSAGATPGGAPTTGYTQEWNDSITVGSNAGFKVVSSIETSSATTTFTSTDQVAVIATYKASGTASGKSLIIGGNVF